ncbi:MAG: hypothetical protein A2Y94_10690 [Caldithrix sp. RBG_13_44_9]|nr:MAG: hypothetical protein A2Y94_10690 [Caldithrix sp. RBG_13_44_9]
MARKILLIFLRIGISLGLVIYLIYITDIPHIISILKNIDPAGILLAIIAFIVSVILLSLRWHLLTRSYGMTIKLMPLFVYYFIGLFFNNFLPTSIGGDLSRAYYLARQSGENSASIGTVFLERLVGLLATLSFAVLSFFWLMKYFHTYRIIYITLAVIILISLFLATVMSRRLYKKFNGFLSLITFYQIGDKVKKVFDTLHFYRNKKLILLGIYLYSLLAQFVLIIMNYILARSLGLFEISFGYLILVVPITFVIGLLPSINGIGVRDTGYLLLLTRLGLKPAEVLSLSFTVTVIPIFLSLIGGFFFFLYRHKGIESPQLNEETSP